MTIKIVDLVVSTKKEIENKNVFIKALQELKVINGLTHRQHAKINKVLSDNKLSEKYSFVFNKAEAYKDGSAFLLNLENNEKYFFAKPSTYCEIIITDEAIKNEVENLKVLEKAHSFALEREEEINRLNQIIEESKKQILESTKRNMDIASDFHEKFFVKNASSIYISVDSAVHLSVY